MRAAALVVADGVEQAAEAGAAQGEDEQRRERHEDEERVRHAAGQAGAEPGERVAGSLVPVAMTVRW